MAGWFGVCLRLGASKLAFIIVSCEQVGIFPSPGELFGDLNLHLGFLSLCRVARELWGFHVGCVWIGWCLERFWICCYVGERNSRIFEDKFFGVLAQIAISEQPVHLEPGFFSFKGLWFWFGVLPRYHVSLLICCLSPPSVQWNLYLLIKK